MSTNSTYAQHLEQRLRHVRICACVSVCMEPGKDQRGEATENKKSSSVVSKFIETLNIRSKSLVRLSCV